MEIDKKDKRWQRKVKSCLKHLMDCTPIKSYWIVEELLVLAGGDEELVIEAATMENGLDQTKHHIINSRLSKLEDDLYEYDYEEELPTSCN